MIAALRAAYDDEAPDAPMTPAASDAASDVATNGDSGAAGEELSDEVDFCCLFKCWC